MNKKRCSEIPDITVLLRDAKGVAGLSSHETTAKRFPPSPFIIRCRLYAIVPKLISVCARVRPGRSRDPRQPDLKSLSSCEAAFVENYRCEASIFYCESTSCPLGRQAPGNDAIHSRSNWTPSSCTTARLSCGMETFGAVDFKR